MTLVPLLVITNVVGPVPASVDDSAQAVSLASTVTSGEAFSAEEDADLVSLAVQPAMETPARIAASAAVPVLMPSVSFT